MRRSIPVLFLSLASLAVGTLPAEAYPIPPRTIWQQTAESTTVVLARVVSVREPETKQTTAEADFTFLDSIATLEVAETWKGSAPKIVEVSFPAHLGCPAPPRYVPGQEVVAFLVREKDLWQTVGLSYGTLYPSRGEVADYREMVARALVVQKRRPIFKAARTEWAVEAAERPATRWHGLYEVHSNRLRLNEDQLRRISDSFALAPSSDGTLAMVLDLLRGRASREIDEAAVAVIEAWLLEPDIPWGIEDVLERLFSRYGDHHPAQRLAGLGELRWSCLEDRDENRRTFEEELRRRWRQAKQELGIPEVAPAVQPAVGVAGVGANTPD